MRKLVAYFLRGLIVTAPVALTLYIGWTAFHFIDGWLRIPLPGVGFAITIAAITLIGFIASNIFARQALAMFEELMRKLPFVRLLYSSSKDLLSAFVGEKRRFDKPVLVQLQPDGVVMAIGFVTSESMTDFGLSDHVAVYLPGELQLRRQSVRGAAVTRAPHRARERGCHGLHRLRWRDAEARTAACSARAAGTKLGRRRLE